MKLPARVAVMYMVGNALNAAVPILLLPLLTRRLSVERYGLIGMFETLVGLLLPVIGLSLHGAIARQYYERESIDFPRYVGTCMTLTIFSVFFATALVGAFHSPITAITGLPSEWLPVAVLGALGQFLCLAALSMWQVQQQPVRYGVFRLAQTTLNLGLSLLLVVTFAFGWQGRVVAQVVASAAFGLGGVLWMWRQEWARLEWSPEYARHALAFGLPLVPHTIGFWAILMVDRLCVGAMLGPAEVGLYTAGYQIGMGISLLQNSFNQAWTPWFYEHLKMEMDGVRRGIVRFTYLYFIAMLLLAGGLALAAPVLGKAFLGSEFQASIPLVGWIGLGYSFNGMYKMVTNYMFFAHRTGMLAWVTLLTAVAGLALNVLLIRANGLIGAAQASCATFALSFLGTWYLANRVYPMPWALWKASQTSEASPA